jgi:hypothetical protein
LGWINKKGGYFGEPWTDKVIVEWMLAVQVQLRQAELQASDGNISVSSNGSKANARTPRLKSAVFKHSTNGAAETSNTKDTFESPCLATSTTSRGYPQEASPDGEVVDNGNGRDSKNGQGEILKCYGKALPPGALRSLQHERKYARIGATLASLHGRNHSTQASPLFEDKEEQLMPGHAHRKPGTEDGSILHLGATPDSERVLGNGQHLDQQRASVAHSTGDAIATAHMNNGRTKVVEELAGKGSQDVRVSSEIAVRLLSRRNKGPSTPAQPIARGCSLNGSTAMFWNETSPAAWDATGHRASGSNSRGQGQTSLQRRDVEANFGMRQADAEVTEDTSVRPEGKEGVMEGSEEGTSFGGTESLLRHTAMLVCCGTRFMPSPTVASEASTTGMSKRNAGMYGTADTRSPDTARFQSVGSASSRGCAVELDSGEHPHKDCDR